MIELAAHVFDTFVWNERAVGMLNLMRDKEKKGTRGGEENDTFGQGLPGKSMARVTPAKNSAVGLKLTEKIIIGNLSPRPPPPFPSPLFSLFYFSQICNHGADARP